MNFLEKNQLVIFHKNPRFFGGLQVPVDPLFGTILPKKTAGTFDHGNLRGALPMPHFPQALLRLINHHHPLIGSK